MRENPCPHCGQARESLAAACSGCNWQPAPIREETGERTKTAKSQTLLLTRRGIQWFHWGVEPTAGLILIGMTLSLMMAIAGPVLVKPIVLFNEYSPYVLFLTQLIMIAGTLLATAAPRESKTSRWACASLLVGVVSTLFTLAAHQFGWPMRWTSARWLIVLLQGILMVKYLAVLSQWIHDTEKLDVEGAEGTSVSWADRKDVATWTGIRSRFDGLLKAGILVLVLNVVVLGVLRWYGASIAATLGQSSFAWFNIILMLAGVTLGLALVMGFSRTISAMVGEFRNSWSYRPQADSGWVDVPTDRLRPLGVTLGALAFVAMGGDWYARRAIVSKNRNLLATEILGAKHGNIARTIQRNIAQEMNRSMDDFRAKAKQNQLDEARRIASLEAISIRQARDIWQVNVQSTDRSARQLITEIIEPLGWGLDEGSGGASLDRRVNVDLRDASRLRVVEEICRQVNVTPEYPSPLSNWDGGPLAKGLATAMQSLQPQLGIPSSGQTQKTKLNGPAISFRRGRRSLPVAHAGPVLIELSELNENAPHATGSLQINCWAAGLPESMMAIDQSIGFASVDTIESPNGTSLIAKGSQSGGMISFPWRSYDFALRNLLRDVTEMKISGAVELRIPVGIETVRFDEIQENTSKPVGDGVVTITRVSNGRMGQALHIGVSYRGIPNGKPMFVGVSPNGSFLDTDGLFFSGVGGSGQADFGFNSDAAALIVKFVRVESVRFPFSIPSVRLAKATGQPKSLAELDYSGHPAPISVAIMGVKKESVFNKISLQCTNHSNKDVAEIEFELQYIDDTGETLKTHQSSESSHDFDNPLVPRDQTVDAEVTAFFMPDEATDVLFTLKSISFIDGTDWAVGSENE